MTPNPWRLHIREQGPNDGPALLLLHGFMGSGEEWNALAAALAGYRLLIPDLPGHGDSPFTAPPAPGCLAALADALVERLPRDGRHAIVGYSMGGRIALHALMRHPRRFRAAVLESAGLGLADDTQRRQRLRWEARLADRLHREPLAHFLADWYRLPIFASLADRPALLASLIQRRSRNDPAQLVHALHAFSVARQEDLRPRLAELTMPCLFITGERDTKYAGIAREAAEHSPHGSHLLIPAAGHTPHLEAPADYNPRVARFLADSIDNAPD